MRLSNPASVDQTVLTKNGLLVSSNIRDDLQNLVVEVKHIRYLEINRHQLPVPTIVLRRIGDPGHPVKVIDLGDHHSGACSWIQSPLKLVDVAHFMVGHAFRVVEHGRVRPSGSRKRRAP